MSKKVYEEAEVAALATTIRDITGATTKYKLREMPVGVKDASVVMFNGLVSGKTTDIVIPKGCSKIRAYAFYYAKITSVAIESTRLDGIYASSFAYCSSLTELRISGKSNIRRFGSRAFYNCSNLKVIDLTNYSGSDIPRLDSIDAFDGVHTDCVILVPSKLSSEWKSATNWSAVADRIKVDPERCEHPWVLDATVPRCLGQSSYKCLKCGSKKSAHDYVNGVCTRCGAVE